MTRDEAKLIIDLTVAELQGCKSLELIAKLGMNHPDIFNSAYEIDDLICELVKEKKLYEVEYILPNMKYRVKSFLLPGGTELL